MWTKAKASTFSYLASNTTIIPVLSITHQELYTSISLCFGESSPKKEPQMTTKLHRDVSRGFINTSENLNALWCSGTGNQLHGHTHPSGLLNSYKNNGHVDHTTWEDTSYKGKWGQQGVGLCDICAYSYVNNRTEPGAPGSRSQLSLWLSVLAEIVISRLWGQAPRQAPSSAQSFCLEFLSRFPSAPTPMLAHTLSKIKKSKKFFKNKIKKSLKQTKRHIHIFERKHAQILEIIW